MTTTTAAWTTNTIEVAGLQVRYLQGGSGDPVVAYHHSFGSLGWLEFHDALAQQFTVYVPELPGYGASARADWARSPRDLAILSHLFLDELQIDPLTLVGAGFGGWVAAEMATMNQRRLRRLVLIGAAGIQPREGEILDQIMTDYLDYVRAGFRDEERFAALFGQEPSDEIVELLYQSRETMARVTWKPYMFSRQLPPLLRGVKTPTLVIWGEHDTVVPQDCGRQYVEALPNARLEVVQDAGHLAEMEQPAATAELVARHLGGA